jgi:uncharacterized protein (TIGR02996 family)
MNNSQARELWEQQVVDNPNDLGRHVAFSDWLSAQGDPLGEFIRLQLDLEGQGLSTGARTERLKRQEQLLASHERTWLGDLADTLTFQKARVLEMGYPLDEYQPYRFRRGWLHRLAISGGWCETDDTLARYRSALDACERSRPKPPSRALRARLSAAFDACQRARALGLVNLMRTLATCTSTRLVEHLFLYSFITDRADAFPKAYPSMGRVTRLTLGDDGDPRGSGSDHGELAVPLIGSMPRLEDLFLWLPELEPARLCMAPTLGNLRSLRICLGNAPSTMGWPRAIAGSIHLHNLAHLTFCHVEWDGFSDELCNEIARGTMLRQLPGLQTLALDCVTEQGIWALVRCAELLRLNELSIKSRGDLSGESLERAKEGVGILRKRGVNATWNGETWLRQE